jgi:hypothetical protein
MKRLNEEVCMSEWLRAHAPTALFRRKSRPSKISKNAMTILFLRLEGICPFPDMRAWP